MVLSGLILLYFGLAFFVENDYCEEIDSLKIKRLYFYTYYFSFISGFICQYYGIKVYMCIAIPCLTIDLLALAIQYFYLLSNCHTYCLFILFS